MKALDIGRAVFPEASDEWLSDVIWAHTGYPTFWRPGNPVKQMYRQLRRLKRVLDAGHRPCPMCTSPMEDAEAWECDACHAKLVKYAA